ncbi:MAG: phospholipid/cholesterol/gamma-HCH transport system permease protein, partial [Gammaproteobacteria bacterium]|nr:phospholipid/cholesterol/gamma-HCH transport system permease protein [Gammaproteobacteria bacterium]
MTAPLALERQSDGWRLRLSGDWSLTAIPSIEAQLQNLPALEGTLVCDWTQARAPGISPAWALLRRLAETCGALPALAVRHTGNPPHFLELLQKLHVERHAAYSVQAPPTLERLVGKLGRWAVLQGRHGRGVIVFLGRIATVVGEVFRRPQALRVSSIARHIYETGITAIPIVS